jgi:hypothetical protein
VRIVPGGSSIRDGCYVARGVTCMPPIYINVGSFVDEGTMIDHSSAFNGSALEVEPDVVLVTYMGKIMSRIRRTVLARPERRYFTLDGATELAYQFGEASLLVDGEGNGDVSMEYLLEKRPQMRKIEKTDQPPHKGATTRFVPLTLKAEDAVRLLHSRVVKPPPVFKKILTNRFEVTELSLIELPVYVFRYRYLGREKELRIHGVTGEPFK